MIYKRELNEKSQEAIDNGGHVNSKGMVYDKDGNLVGNADFIQINQDKKEIDDSPEDIPSQDNSEIKKTENSITDTPIEVYIAVGTAIGSLLSSGILYGKLLNDKQKRLIDKLESTIQPYSETILKNIYNRESIATLSELLATVQEITKIKFPIFIKSSNPGWNSFVNVIYLYTQELIKNNPQDGQELPELPKKKKLLKNNHFIAQLKFIEKCLLIQREIIADAVNNIPPLEEESINQTNDKVFKDTKV